MSMDAEYQLDFFKKNGFGRKLCTSCQMPFWTLDHARTLCGDPPCVPYQFVGHPATKRPYSLREMREAFLGFFEKRGHTRVARYPVVARWRDDIYLTIASIADFQPHVTSGEVPPPANPLTISQPCIRLNDLDSVGKSGRHLTTFEMMAHHVFNTPQEQIYFKDQTVAYCHEFLTQTLGMDGKEITYKENPWAGGGNAGPAIEVMIRGLEVATLVFMKWVADPSGPIDVKGERYREMDLQIVDTGYGLERLVWISNGAPTIYQALFPDAVRFLLRETGLEERVSDPRVQGMLAETAKASSIMSVDTGVKVMELRKKVHASLQQKGVEIGFEEMLGVWEPLEKVYALSDHARCLAFMLGDGIVPSNVKAGYLNRMVIRKCLRMMEDLKLDASVTLYRIVEVQLKAFEGDFPELSARKDYIKTVLDLETARYAETLEKGRRLVEREAKAFKGKPFPLEKLIDLYDSQGINPEIVKAVAEPLGVIVDIPDDFYSAVANKHAKAKPGESEVEEQEDRRFEKLPSTRPIYYEDSTIQDFRAKVVWAQGDLVVLDQTAFYPEGGGQPADHGILHSGGHGDKMGTKVEVVDVQKYATSQGGHVIAHKVKGGTLPVGAEVHGHVDWDRRTGHTRHHTATHLILASAKQVLGFHTWQGGAQKGYDRSRVDIQHYQRITDEQLRAIEELANKTMLEARGVEKVWMGRDEAEKKFGMQLYQGGIPKGKLVRVVKVKALGVPSGHAGSAPSGADFDVECCGGTHVGSTHEIGPIKILRTERIQDGLERIEFAAGIAAIKQMQKKDEILKQTAETLAVQIEEVPKTAQRFFDEWKQLRKENEGLKARLAELESKNFSPLFEAVVEGHAVQVDIKPVDAATLRNLAQEYAKNAKGAVAVVNLQGHFVVAGPGAVPIAKKLASGRAGGKDTLAQGSIPDFAAGDAKQVESRLRALLG